MVTMGISRPKVPQDVPIEKDISAAITNTTKGNSCNGTFDDAIKPEMNSPVPISSRHTPPSVHERIRISMGGTILPIPLTILPANALGFMILRGM